MSESSSTVRDVAETVKGVVEAVPVYQDLLQPAVQEVGKALQTVAKLTHVALAPVSALVWGYEEIRGLVTTRVAAKLASTPPDQIVTPKAFIAGPALEALRWTGSEEALREMYANLLATSMDARTAANAHPGFVEIIKQLTPDEAKMLVHFSNNEIFPIINVTKVINDDGGFINRLVNFSIIGELSGCEHNELTPQYLDNLSRLGIIRIPDDAHYSNDKAYDGVINHPKVLSLIKDIEAEDEKGADISKKIAVVTEMGKQFIESCVRDREDTGS